MSHYVIIDGVLQKRSSATDRWARRASRAVPRETEEQAEPMALFQVDHSEAEEDTE